MSGSSATCGNRSTAKPLQACWDDGGEQLLFAAEMGINRGLGHPGRLGDLVHADRAIAFRDEQVLGGLHDFQGLRGPELIGVSISRFALERGIKSIVTDSASPCSRTAI
jgi:hypothetical protein